MFNYRFSAQDFWIDFNSLKKFKHMYHHEIHSTTMT